MRFYLVSFFFLTFFVNGQQIEKIKLELSKIQTLPEAHEYIRNNEKFQGEIVELLSGTDTTTIDLELLETNKGAVIDFDSDDKKVHYFYKTIETKFVNSYRLQYIYLNTWKHTIEQVDSTRAVILKRHNNGESFYKLAQEYSMDVNGKNGGDRGWFEEGRMHTDIESKLKTRKLNEVYTVDVPANQWYYIIKHTHLPRVDKKIKVLKIEAEN